MSDNEIKLLKNNEKRSDSDLEWVREFYDFLRGELPTSIRMSRKSKPKMSAQKAMAIVWYLQEHFPVFPDHFERCTKCNQIYNTYSEGEHVGNTGVFHCGSCM